MAKIFWTIAQKKKVVEDIEKRKATASLRLLCKEHKIQVIQYKNWKQSLEDVTTSSKKLLHSTYFPQGKGILNLPS